MASTKATATLVAFALGGWLAGVSGMAMAQTSGGETKQRYWAIQEQHGPALLAMPGVTAVGVAPSRSDPDKLVIRIYVRRDISDADRGALPTTLDGAPVELIESDPVAPQ